MSETDRLIQDADRLIQLTGANVSWAWSRRDWLGWWISSAALLGFRIGRWMLVKRSGR